MAAGLMSLAFLVHLTTAMVIVPAAALAYVAAVVRAAGRSRSRGADGHSRSAIEAPRGAGPNG